VLSYLDQYAEQYQQVGPDAFRRLHPWASLVALGMAGDLNDRQTSGTSIINLADSVLERGRIAGRVFPLVKSRDSPRGPISVGRTSENDIVIPEYSVSRAHCIIALVNEVYRITDLGSANGTLVDGVEIGTRMPHRLAGGEILTMGRLMLYFLPPREFVEHVRAVAPPGDFGPER
jgi:hypothetical protein